MRGNKHSTGPQFLDGIGGLERKALFGGIEHNSAPPRFKLEVGNPPGLFLSWLLLVLTVLEQLLSGVCRSTIRIPADVGV